MNKQHGTPTIHIHEASASYGRKSVIKDLDFTVGKGERILITGPNGSGKSTLLKIISGNLPASRGSVEVLGNELSKPLARNYVKRSIGVLTQVQSDPQIAITVEESVLLGLWGTRFSWFRRSTKEDLEKARQRLELVDMENFSHRDIRTLSGGQLQRVACARALIRDPQLVLMDEPTTYLDTSAKHEILELIERLQQQFGFTSIMVSHDPLGKRLSDRVLHMEDGKLVEITEARL